MPTIPATCRAARRSSISSAGTASSSATVPDALKRGGKLAILMGDYSDREAGYVPLVYHTKRLAFAAGLQPALHRHHPVQPRRQQRQEGLPQSASSPACTTCA